MGGEGESSKAEKGGLDPSTLYVEFESRILPRLRRASDETERFLILLAWLNTLLEERGLGRIIVTGGFAVEVYTGRTYRTMDVDIIVEGREAATLLEQFLGMVGERIGRGYLPRTSIIALKSIDIVGTVYRKQLKPVKLKVNSYHVYLEPPEELIVTYLAGWKYWGSTEDRDKALWLLAAMTEHLNMNHLRRRAREENVEDRLEQLIKLLEEATQDKH